MANVALVQFHGESVWLHSINDPSDVAAPWTFSSSGEDKVMLAVDAEGAESAAGAGSAGGSAEAASAATYVIILPRCDTVDVTS